MVISYLPQSAGVATLTIGQKLKGGFPQRGGSSHWCPWGGFWGRVQGDGRGCLPLENEGKGEGLSGVIRANRKFE